MDMVDRIREEMALKNVKQKDLIEYLEVNQGTFAKWLSRKEENRRDIPVTILFEIANFLEVDVAYLVGMQDVKIQHLTQLKELKDYDETIFDIHDMPLAGEPKPTYGRDIQIDNNYVDLPTTYAGAGAVGYAVDVPEQRAYPKDLIPPSVALDENVLVIIIAGNSMEPLYYENDVVFIDMVNGRDFTPIDGTYLVRYGDTVQIKDVMFLGNSDIMISSRNNNQRIKIKEDLGIDDWEIVGKPYVQLHATVGSKLLIEQRD